VKVSGCDLAVLGERMRVAREALGLTQTAFHEQYGYGSVRTYQKNEAGANEAGMCLVGVFVRAGINANWLLTGEDPMLLADLVPSVQAAPPAPPPAVNVDAMVQAVMVAQKAAPQGETQAQSVRRGIEFYLFCMERGLITPEGQGSGYLDTAA